LLTTGIPSALWRRLNPVSRKNVGDRAVTDLMARIGERASDSSIAPGAQDLAHERVKAFTRSAKPDVIITTRRGPHGISKLFRRMGKAFSQ
jgi:hypothetical protein